MNVSQDTSRVVLISLYLTCITVNDINIPVWLSGSVTVWLSGRALRLLRKGCGFDSQGTHILTIQMYNLNAL